MLRKIKFKDYGSKGLIDLIKRETSDFKKEEAIVEDILKNIRENGDSALFSYMGKFDKANINADNIAVSDAEVKEALKVIDKDLYETIKLSAKNIKDFHEKINIEGFVDKSKPGIALGVKVTPLERVGVYVPGGKASYPSTVLMDSIPAKVAGVKEIIMVTPPGADGKINPSIIAAAHEAGVDKILKIGGAQAIGALAFGTESVPKVDKIVGPGNIFVACAKRLVFGIVGLDSVAGPSEITVVADKNANPKFVAADMLSQAEHDEMAQSILITDDEALADSVSKEIDNFLEVLPRREIMEKSLDSNGLIILCDSLDEACEAANTVAPEHLELQVDDPWLILDSIKNAGAIFLGSYSSEPLGDYFAGPNHVLPTNGTARFFSPLSTHDFVKRSSIISYDKDAFDKAAEHVVRFADAEGLTAHANSIRVRMDK